MANDSARMAAFPLALPVCILLALCAGCASNNPDPFEKVNRGVYSFNDGLDRVLLKPVSRGYTKITPRPVQNGVSNFFENLTVPNVILNDLLQGKFGPALGGAGRMAVNTTVGLLGTVDVATKWGLPAHRNDLGLTLGHYGVKPGPYLVLPLLGPSTLRDSPDILSRRFTNPLYYISMGWEPRLAITCVQVTDARTRADWAIRFRDRAAIDPYVFTRETYMRYRVSLLYPDQPPGADEDFYDIPDLPTTRPATQPAVNDPSGDAP